MKAAKILFLFAGVALLAVVLRQADLGQLWAQVSAIGWHGVGVILAIYIVAFGTDVAGWKVVLDAFAGAALHTAGRLVAGGRLYAVRMIGEAYNNITPLGSMGGEPVKAWLLKHNYGVALRDAGASLVIVKTSSMLALVLFVAAGFALALWEGRLTEAHRLVAALAFAWLTFIIGMFYLIQRLKVSTLTATRLGKTRLGQRLAHTIAGMQDIDDRFEIFYTRERPRLAAATAFSMASWLLGATELYAILALSGHPIRWTEAWMIDAAVQLVRTIAFFIPAGIGAQEGALFLSCAAILGQPALGVAIALVRRSRELTWIALALLLASAFSVSPRQVSAARQSVGADG